MKISSVFTWLLAVTFLNFFLETRLANAQSKTQPVSQTRYKSPTRRSVPALNDYSTQGSSVAVKTPTPEKPSDPTKFKLSYTAEYEGNRLMKPIDQVVGLDGSIGSATITHDLKVGYQVSKAFTMGLRPRVVQNLSPNLDPTAPLPTFKPLDFRVYTNWKGMLETQDIKIDGGFTVELPTSEGSQKNGRIIRFNLAANTTFKTSLRNWTFMTVFIASPRFNRVMTPTTTDFVFVAVPIVAVDIAASWQIQAEFSFDATHQYGAAMFDFTGGDPDNVKLGPVWNIDDHFSLNPALAFYFSKFGFHTATTYLNFSAAL